MILKLRYYPDPYLRVSANEVGVIDDKVRELVQNMRESLVAYNGLGLAATQVGVDLSVFLIRDSDKGEPIEVINPKIISTSGRERREEGCLSFPELYLDIERSGKVKLKFYDINGQEREIEFEGILARAVQHEMDHLKGVLIIDRVSRTKRELIKGELEKIAERYGRKF